VFVFPELSDHGAICPAESDSAGRSVDGCQYRWRIREALDARICQFPQHCIGLGDGGLLSAVVGWPSRPLERGGRVSLVWRVLGTVTWTSRDGSGASRCSWP